MGWGTAIAAIGGSLISGMMSKDASDEVSEASRESVAEQRRQFNELRDDLRPYRQTGQNALYGMSEMLGMGGQEYYETLNRLRELQERRSETDKFTTEFDTGDYRQVQTPSGETKWIRKGDGPLGRGSKTITTEDLLGGTSENQRITEEWKNVNQEIEALEQELQELDPQAQGAESQFDISQTPGYQFRMDQGVNALNRSLAATGNRLSGRAVKAATRYGQGLASQEFSNRFNRLASLSGRGQAAVETSGAAGMQAAGQMRNALMAGGRARAAGIAGQNQAIQGGIGNYLSYQQNQNLLNQPGFGNYSGGAGGSYGTGTGSSPVAAYGR